MSGQYTDVIVWAPLSTGNMPFLRTVRDKCWAGQCLVGGSRSKVQAWLTSHTSERPGHMVGCSHPVCLCGYMGGAPLVGRVADTGNLCPWLLRAARSGAQDRKSCAWLSFFKKCLCQLLILKTLKHIENLQEECNGHLYTLCPDPSFWHIVCSLHMDRWVDICI